MEGEGDHEALVPKRDRSFCSLGAIVNYTLALNFLAIFVSSIVVIGTLASLQSDLCGNDFYHNTSAPNVSSHVCILYAECNNDPNNESGPCIIAPNGNRACEGTMTLFGLMMALSLAFIVSLIIKAFLRHDLNWTVLVEIPVLAVALLFEFIVSIMLSIGVAITCGSVNNHNNNDSGCHGTFPNATFTLGRAYVAMETAWFTFLFIFITLVIFGIRMAVYYRRKKKAGIMNTIEKENFVETVDESLKPV